MYQYQVLFWVGYMAYEKEIEMAVIGKNIIEGARQHSKMVS